MHKNLIKSQLLRYLFIGGCAYVIDVGILAWLFYGFHIPRGVAAGISFWFGLVFSFLAQKFVAFKDYQKEAKALSRQSVGYSVLVSINYVFTIFIVSFFPAKDLIASKTLAVALTTVWNYFAYKHLIFSGGKADSEESED